MPLQKIKPSLRWSNDQKPLVSQIAVSALGLAGPIAMGAVTGQIGEAMAAGMGGMAMAAVIPQQRTGLQIAGLLRDLTVSGCGFTAGLFLSGNWLPLISLILLAALLSSSSRDMVRLMNLLVIFALIASGMKVPPPQLLHFSLFFVLGGLWSGLLGLLLIPLFRQLCIDHPRFTTESTTSVRVKLQHWIQSLHHFSGWQYSLRLAGCMSVGAGMGNYWVPAHTYWILLTVFLVQDRHFPASIRKTFERGAGTVAGVILVAPAISLTLSVTALTTLIFILAAVRPVFKSANYLAYSAIMTPLIMLIMSLGHDAQLESALHDRLFATLIACALVLVSDKFIWHHSTNLIRQHRTHSHHR